MPLEYLSDASRIPLEYLSDASRIPLGEIYKQQNNLFTADEACHVAINM